VRNPNKFTHKNITVDMMRVVMEAVQVPSLKHPEIMPKAIFKGEEEEEGD
jgi:hypothetical protein